MHRPHARMAQRTRRVQQHIAFVVGNGEAEWHDQGAAFQFVIEQGSPGNRHAHARNRRLDSQVVAVEGMPAPYVGGVIADGIQVELPLCVLITPTPGSDVVQQREMHQVSGAMQWRSPRSRLGAHTGKICSSSKAVDNKPG